MNAVYVVLNPSHDGDIFHGVFGSLEPAKALANRLDEEGCHAFVVTYNLGDAP